MDYPTKKKGGNVYWALDYYNWAFILLGNIYNCLPSPPGCHTSVRQIGLTKGVEAWNLAEPFKNSFVNFYGIWQSDTPIVGFR